MIGSRIVWSRQRRVQVEIERYEKKSDTAFAAGIMFARMFASKIKEKINTIVLSIILSCFNKKNHSHPF